MQVQCFLLIHSTVDRNTGPEGFERIDIGERSALISFFVNSELVLAQPEITTIYQSGHCSVIGPQQGLAPSLMPAETAFSFAFPCIKLSNHLMAIDTVTAQLLIEISNVCRQCK